MDVTHRTVSTAVHVALLPPSLVLGRAAATMPPLRTILDALALNRGRAVACLGTLTLCRIAVWSPAAVGLCDNRRLLDRVLQKY